MITKTCPTCGKKYEPKSAPQVYCSDACREAMYVPERVCPICGKTFRSASARTCSRKCAHELSVRTKKTVYNGYNQASDRKIDMRRYHSDTLDRKCKEWGSHYGEHQKKETLCIVGRVDVEGFLRGLDEKLY